MDYATLTPQELVRECARTGHPAAWAEFIQRFNRIIASTVLRTARQWGETSPDVVEDLVQDVYLKLCAGHGGLLTRFEGEHPGQFYAYLKKVTANLVQDYFKAIRAQKRGAGLVAESLDAPECSSQPISTESKDPDWSILMGEIDTFLRSSGFSERERDIFWLYYLQGFTAIAISVIPAVQLSVKGVESALGRMTHQVREYVAGEKGLSATSSS